MIWIIRGTHRSTNTPREFRIEAASERDARSMAAAAGLVVSTITPLAAHDHPVATAAPPAPARAQRPPAMSARTVPIPPPPPSPAARPRASRYSLLRDPVILIIALAANVIYFLATGQLSALTGAGDTRDVSAHLGRFIAFLLGFYLISLLVAWIVSRLTGRRPLLARMAFLVCTILLLAICIAAYRLHEPEQLHQALATTRPTDTNQIVGDPKTAVASDLSPAARAAPTTAAAPAPRVSTKPTTRLSPAYAQHLPRMMEVT
jgi:hypothetical protein